MQPQCLFSSFMVAVARNNNRNEIVSDFPATLKHLETAHPWHLDVCNQHINLVILEILNTLLCSVGSCCLIPLLVRLSLDASA